MQHYCTLFNTGYLSRAMVMYDSLVETKADFHLYIFAFDDAVYQFFSGVGKKNNTTVVSLDEFEDNELLGVKQDRSFAEYCWTCTPSVILYAIKKFDLPACTYIDADLFFFSDPRVLIEEMGQKSVLITEHRFTKEYEKGIENGIYCVQFLTFKNDNNGMMILQWWRNACIEWCYARAEDGKFGDQKYLDDWLVRFDGIHVLKHLGGGVAPWNVQQYTFHQIANDVVYGVENKSDTRFSMVFFHFHSLKFHIDNTIYISNYPTPKTALELVYQPYIKMLLSKETELSSLLPGVDPSGKTQREVADNGNKWARLLTFYWQDCKTAAKYLLGKNIKKRREAHNLYSNEYFNKY